jgi:glucokinase
MTTLVAGADLGGTTVSIALATCQGTIVAEAKIPTDSHEGPERVLSRISDQVLALVSEVGQSPAAFGLGVPGLVDLKAGTTKFLPNMPTQWRDVEVARLVTARLDCPVRLLNDARAATLGELRFGLGKTINSMAMLTLGTGVGGGIAIDGKLVLGPLGAAGELGHQRILPDGPPCGCGQRGCLETLVSGPAFTGEGVRLLRAGLAPGLHKLVGGDISKVSPREMAQAAREGDEVLAQSIRRRAGYLGIGVANVVTIIHPDLVVLAGGVAEMGDILIDPVRTAARKHVGMFPTENVQVEKSILGEKAGLLGTIALAAESLTGR